LAIAPPGRIEPEIIEDEAVAVKGGLDSSNYPTGRLGCPSQLRGFSGSMALGERRVSTPALCELGTLTAKSSS
jgi:hypothetical protein